MNEGGAQPHNRRHRPQVSVVVATHKGEATLDRALESLARQTLSVSEFEILVVLNGPPGGSPRLVHAFTKRHPELTVRTLFSREPGLSNARNIAVAAARGDHLTYLDDDDRVSANYLAALLDAAAPGVIPVAHIADVHFADDGSDEPLYESFYGKVTLPRSGETLPAEKVGAILQVNAGKLIPVPLARSVEYCPSLRSGEDFVYWVDLFAHAPFHVHVTERDVDCFYYRTVRAGSMSQQPLGYDFNVTQRLDCIARLERVRPTSEVGRQMAERVIRAQCRRMNEFLREHPDRHGDVVEDIRLRGLTSVPFDIVNEGLARDLAMLYMFLPHIDASALVAARRIRERGVVVDVITNRMTKVRRTDPTSWAIAAEFVDEVRVTKARPASAYWPAVRGFTRRALEQADELQRRKGPYRSVYSRAQWPASHIAAAAFKLRNPGATWLAEMSDPMLIGIRGARRANQMADDELFAELKEGLEEAGFDPPEGRYLHEWIEHLVYALADEVLFTNENQRDYMLGYCTNPELAAVARAKSTAVWHPVLPKSFYERSESLYTLDPSVANIGYFGTFYATRGLTEVADGLRLLSPRTRAGVRLHVFTDKPEEVTADATAAGLDDVIRVNPFVPFFEVLNLATRMDALLINDARTQGIHSINPYLPSKWSDYLGSGTPIWVLYEQGSVLSGQDVAYRSPLGDARGAAEVLEQIVAAHQAKGPQER